MEVRLRGARAAQWGENPAGGGGAGRGGPAAAAAAAEDRENRRELRIQRTRDIEQARANSKLDEIARASDDASSSRSSGLGSALEGNKAYKNRANTPAATANAGVGIGPGGARVAVVHGLDRPLFHIDLTSALLSAVANVERRREDEVSIGKGQEMAAEG